MAQQIINIGNRANSGGGDPLRTAMDKINDNFTELYARDVNTDAQTLSLVGNTLSISGGNSVSLDISPTGDLTGSVFADDSTLLVDGVAGKIRGDIESGTVNITSTTGDVNITAADDIDLTTTQVNGDIRLNSFDDISLNASDTLLITATTGGIDISNTDNIYAVFQNDFDFISDAGSGRIQSNGRMDVVSETGRVNIEGLDSRISVETDLIIFTNAITANNPTGTNNNIQFKQNGNVVAEAFQGDIFDDAGNTKLLDASAQELLCDVAYTPLDDTDWNGTAPTTVGEALDRLAAVVKILNGGTGA